MSHTQLLKCFKQEANKIGFGFCEVIVAAMYKTDGRVAVTVRVEGYKVKGWEFQSGWCWWREIRKVEVH